MQAKQRDTGEGCRRSKETRARDAGEAKRYEREIQAKQRDTSESCIRNFVLLVAYMKR
jgi:hypothetical protein